MEFDFNVQHDCPSAGCSATGKRARRQERVVSDDVFDDTIEQRDVDEWIINVHSLHNGHLLRARVRPELISPAREVPIEERQRRHREIASVLRPGQDKRRKHASDKRAAKKVSTAVNVGQGLPTSKPGIRRDELEPMDVDEVTSGQ